MKEITMFLVAYHFDGEPVELLAAYDRTRATAFPPQRLLFHACLARAGGITVLDACPNREVFESFSSGTEFASVLAQSGLPQPRVEPLGDVHASVPSV